MTVLEILAVVVVAIYGLAFLGLPFEDSYVALVECPVPLEGLACPGAQPPEPVEAP